MRTEMFERRIAASLRIRYAAAAVLGCIAVVLLSVQQSMANGQNFTVLHSFIFGQNDGYQPTGSLALSGSVLYGGTNVGGSYNQGVIFSVGAGGTGYTVLCSVDGQFWGTPTLSGSTLYGMCMIGGSNYDGSIFKMGTNGTGYTILHSFMGGSSDGSGPKGSLTLGGSSLYGMTEYGGSNDGGTLFRIGTNGTGYQVLRSFDGSACPFGSLTLSGSILYGMTIGGSGSDSRGTIFSVDTDGTGFNLLHAFGTTAGDGTNPTGGLTLSGSTLYGMTYSGGNDGNGAIFSVGTNGTGYKILHLFSNADGIWPQGDLTLVGSTLYGMTRSGGGSSDGTIFSIRDDGSGFTVLHSFTDGSNDGGDPQLGSLTLSGSDLYGLTYHGGTGGGGVVFSQSVPEPSTLALLAAGALGLLGYAWRKRKRDADQMR